MRNKYGLIIIVLIVVLLLGEVILFFTKAQVVSFFDNQENLADLTKPLKITSVKTIDDAAIKSDKFKSLKNNVNNFSFNDICKRPNGTVAVVVATTTEIIKNPDGTIATSTPPDNINCTQGNTNLFVTKKSAQ